MRRPGKATNDRLVFLASKPVFLASVAELIEGFLEISKGSATLEKFVVWNEKRLKVAEELKEIDEKLSNELFAAELNLDNLLCEGLTGFAYHNALRALCVFSANVIVFKGQNSDRDTESYSKLEKFHSDD